jgi:hypothetical protein
MRMLSQDLAWRQSGVEAAAVAALSAGSDGSLRYWHPEGRLGKSMNHPAAVRLFVVSVCV